MYDAGSYLHSKLFANWETQTEREPIEMRLFRRGLERLSEFGSRGRLLDVGCGRGLFLKLAQEKGWKVEGVDVSRHAAEYGRRSLGIEVRTGTLEEAAFRSQSFDAVTLWDCLEHVDDPLGTLREVHRVLRERGRCLVLTPNMDSLIPRLGTFLSAVSLGEIRTPVELLYDRHHNYFFTETNLREMLARAGFPAVLAVDRFGAHISRWQTVPIREWMARGVNVLDQIARWLRWDYRLLVCARRAEAGERVRP